MQYDSQEVSITYTGSNASKKRLNNTLTPHKSVLMKVSSHLRNYMSLKLVCSLLVLGLSGCSQQAQTVDSTNSNQAINTQASVSNQTNTQSNFSNSSNSNSNNSSSSNQAPSTDLPKIGKTYSVITVPDFVPFVYREADGHIAGFDIDVINAIADVRGFSIDIVTMPRRKLFDNITPGTYDIIAAAMSITEERKKKVDFSDPYFQSKQTVLLNQKLPKANSFQELTKYTIAAQAGTTSDAVVKEIFSQSPDKINYVDTVFLGVRSVISGKLDGIMSDSGVMYHYYRQNPTANLQIFSDPSYPVEDYGFVVSKGRDDGLLQEINLGLKTIQSNGTYQKIVTNWFGNTMAEKAMAKN